jgi:hypothetical protein
MPDDKTNWPSPPPAAPEVPPEEPSKLPGAPRAPMLVAVSDKTLECPVANVASAYGANAKSLEPGDSACDPVLRERARRKAEDDDTRTALKLIQSSVDTNHKLTRKAAAALFAMVLMAALEYMGVLGNGKAPIWAKALIDAIVPAVAPVSSESK